MRSGMAILLLWVIMLSGTTPRKAYSWDQASALSYAASYCSFYNGEYCSYELDCSNFLSQILTYGCQNLCESPYWSRCSSAIDNDAACTDCNGTQAHRTIPWAASMKSHLDSRTVYYQKIRDPNNTSVDYWEAPMDLPSWVGAGFIFLMSDATGTHRHCLIGASGSGAFTDLYAHTHDICAGENLSSYWNDWGPDGQIAETLDRFWVFQVIASPAANSESHILGGEK
jgi:hypothetical protein